MNKSEEFFLLQRLKEGDTHAFEVIFNYYYSNLRMYLLLLFKNELLVDHIAQDIFVYLWENRETLEIKTSLESYLYSAGRYKALFQIRNNQLQEVIRKKIGTTPGNTMIETMSWKISNSEKSSTTPLQRSLNAANRFSG
jgi:DNA-directed RNA polymerase specialized sigma24 family protein